MNTTEKKQVFITQNGNSRINQKDYLVSKEQEYYSNQSLEKQINKYYRIKD